VLSTLSFKICYVLILLQTVHEDTTKKPKMVKRAVIGLTTVVVVALIVSLSIYFGMKATRDTYKVRIVYQTFGMILYILVN